jgi:hypothetical protein
MDKITPVGRGPSFLRRHCTDSVIFVAWSLGGIPSPCGKIKASVSMISSNTLVTGLVVDSSRAESDPLGEPNTLQNLQTLQSMQKTETERMLNIYLATAVRSPGRSGSDSSFRQLSESYCRRRPCRSWRPGPAAARGSCDVAVRLYKARGSSRRAAVSQYQCLSISKFKSIDSIPQLRPFMYRGVSSLPSQWNGMMSLTQGYFKPHRLTGWLILFQIYP